MILGRGATSSASVPGGAAGLAFCAFPGDEENGDDILENHEPLRCGVGGVPFGPGNFFSSTEPLRVTPCLVGIGFAPGGVAANGGEGGGDIGAPLLFTFLGVLDCAGWPFIVSRLGREDVLCFAICLPVLSVS